MRWTDARLYCDFCGEEKQGSIISTHDKPLTAFRARICLNCLRDASDLIPVGEILDEALDASCQGMLDHSTIRGLDNEP